MAINARLSLMGALACHDRDEFTEFFTAETTGGLYSRMVIAPGPTGWKWSAKWQPKVVFRRPSTKPIHVPDSVYNTVEAWRDSAPEGRKRGRICEIVYRTALISASINGDTEITPACIAAAIAFGAFALAETRHPEPLIRLDMFRHAGLRRGSALALLMGLWNGGEMLVLSLYFQQVLHESPLVTGLAIAPQGMAGFTAGMFGTQLAARFGGVRRLLAVTAAASAAGFLVLTQLPAAGYSPLLLAVMLIGFGTAGTAFGSIVIASRGVPDSDQGVVGGMINTSRQIGAAIGAALLPAVALGVGHEAGVAGVTGDRAAMLTGAVASVLAMLLAWRASRAGDPVAQPR